MSGLAVTMHAGFLLLKILRGLLGLFLAAYLMFAGISVWAAQRWHHARRVFPSDFTPPVTILKPVRGMDAAAYDNFASFCRLDYPTDHVQLIFGALDPEDPVLAIVRQLQHDFPTCDITLVAPPMIQPALGPNLKACNLLAMLPHAKHDLLVLCDSDMRVQSHYLREVVAPFKSEGDTGRQGDRDKEESCREPGTQNSSVISNRVGLVTCPYRGFLPQSFAARLEALGIGADFIPSTLVSRALEGVSFAFGSTIALPKNVLKELGGFETLLEELADDFRLGNGANHLGYKVVLSNYVVEDVLGAERFGPMWARRLRWARTVRACRPAGYAGVVVTHGTPLSLLFALLMGHRIGVSVAVAIIVVRIIVALWISTYTDDTNIRRFWWLLPVSDLFSFALYIASFCGNQIVWRGDRFRLRAGGKIERCA